MRTLPATLFGLLLSAPAAAQDWGITSFTTPSSVTPGQTFQVSATVFNYGPAAYDSFIAVRASDDNQYDITDEFICYLPNVIDYFTAGVGSSESITVDCTFPSGATSAQYIVAGLFTSGASDPDRSDNERVRPVTVGSGTTGPDLVAESVSGPASSTPGGNLGLSFVVRNDGDAASTATDSVVRLGTGTYSPSMPSVCTASVGALQPAAQTTVTPTGCAIPPGTSPGNYSLYAEVNPSAASSDTAPANDVTSTPITISPTPQPDLVAELVAPSSVQRGDVVSIDWTVRNEGNASAGASTLRLDFVDANATRTTGLCGPAAVPTVNAGATRTGQVTGCTIPALAAYGSGRFEAVADAAGVVPESDEGNNTGTANVTVTQAPPPSEPDLVVANAAPPVEVAPGDAFTLNAGLRNTGTANANNITTVVRWSTSDRPGSAVDIIGQDTGRSLSSGAPTASVSIACTVPTTAGAGTSYLHVTIDDPDTVTEADETNNTRIVPIAVVATSTPMDTADSGLLDTFDSDDVATDTDRGPDGLDTDMPATPGIQQLGCACNQRGTPSTALVLGLAGLLGLRRRR